MNKVITRFAPSPTGYFHVGSYRTALFSWIYARQNGGKFILRIEDTDKERSKKEYEENIIESLKWLGLNYDQFYRQSDRVKLYESYIQKLIKSGHAYVSDEKESQVASDKLQVASRTQVIRFKNPNKKVIFDDLIRGRVEFDTTELGDFVIAKSFSEPIFHLVNVIDDLESGITHIIRGEDHISNTPRQILIFEALGVTPPKYVHIPLLLGSDRSKMSKRNGAVPITDYKSKGYLANAIINYLALLGWHPADDREVLSIDDLLKEFSLNKVQKSGAIFDEKKLKWFNRQYLLKMSNDQFRNSIVAFLPEWLSAKNPLLEKLIPIIKEKIDVFGDIDTLFNKDGELAFINHLEKYDTDMLLWKKTPDKVLARKHLEECRKLLGSISKDSFTADNIKTKLWPYVEINGRGDVLWPLRVALTGQEKSPDPVVSAHLLGQDESLERIDVALRLLK